MCRHIGIAIVLMSLTACATGMKPRAPDFDMPLTYDSAAQGELPSAELDQWWLLYDDAQLTQLVERALAQGFDARAARARLEEAQAIRSSALSRYNLQGDLQGSAEVRETRDVGDDETETVSIPGLPAGSFGGNTGQTRNGNLSLPISWEIDLFGRRAAARGGANADLAAARFDYEATRSMLVADVARSLFAARGLLAQLDDARANADIQRKLMELLNKQVQRGITASSQADRVAADVAQADAQALQLESESKATRRALLALLGDGLDPLATLQVNEDIGTVPAIPLTLPSDLLERRPDVRRADARIRSSAGKVRLAELEFFPRLTLQPGIGLSAQRGNFDSTTGFWSLGLGLGLPILDRPRLSAALRAESARGQQVVVAYERSVQTAYSESDQALTRLQADRQRVQVLVDGQERARRSYDAALKRYQLGFSDLQTVLDAERAWRSTRTALTTARIDALQRSVQVFQALGGGWPATQILAESNDEN